MSILIFLHTIHRNGAELKDGGIGRRAIHPLTASTNEKTYYRQIARASTGAAFRAS